ncbi:MAG: helix-turn-helix domain-containing protein [Beijerinckiaceae bacterium]
MARKPRSDASPGGKAPPATINAAVGRTIRELRELKGITARDLAMRASISAAMVSRIESGQVSPSLATLEMIASALEAPFPSFFRDVGPSISDFTHVRSGQGLKSTRQMGRHAHEFTVLGFHRRADLQFECLLVTLQRNEAAQPPTYTGHGCVFVYILEGEAIYRYGQQEIRMREGDSISLDAELRYGIQKVISPRLKFLSVQAERR